jgi:hypothetical protein
MWWIPILSYHILDRPHIGLSGLQTYMVADDFITEEAERVHFGWGFGNFPSRKMADYSRIFCHCLGTPGAVS